MPFNQQEIAFPGIESSPSFVRSPQGNGVAERFLRTLKERLPRVQSFGTVEELRLARLAFRGWFSQNWLLKRRSYMTPAEIRAQYEPAREAACVLD